MKFLIQLAKSIKENTTNLAFCINGIDYSYGCLAQYIVAAQELILLKNPLGKARIGIIANNDLETYATILACWFSDCSYVPLNPSFPKTRNELIIGESKIELVIDSREEWYTPVVDQREIKVSDSVDDNSELYVLFTSGSTGIPKGVPISVSNVQTFVTAWDDLNIRIREDDKFLQMFDLTFDVSIACFLLPLLNGASVFTVASDGFKYLNVAKIIQEHQITFATIVPSIISLLRPYSKRLHFSSVRNCVLTAEATYYDLLEILKNLMPNAQVANLYGPTEGTIWVSCMKTKSDQIKSYNGLIAIGKPFAGTKAIICDESLNELPPFEKGELLISGGQITRGYLNNLDRNKSSFIRRKDEHGQAVFYRTGDFCYIDEVGDIFYCGRIDNQVKLQGFRIELGEIEYLVRKQFGNNVVVVSHDKNGETILTLVLESKDAAVVADARKYLEEKLPLYMIPGQIKAMANFPLTTSGKVDRVKINSEING